MKTSVKIFAALIGMSLPLACFAQEMRPGASEWHLYRNQQEGFSLKLPPQLKVAFNREREKEAAADTRMPFEYVNFRASPATGAWEVFELGVGVHWNRDALGTRDFADKKDEGLIMAGARIVTVKQSEVTVAGIKGVRDDFRMLQPDGWKSYARVIIPFKDTFFVFLCTLGKARPLAENEKVFQAIADSFQIENLKHRI